MTNSGGARLQGRVAIVTGAGRGIGRGQALLLAAEGAQVVVNDLGATVAGERDGADNPADEVVHAIRDAGGTAVANYDSVASLSGAERIVQTALDSFGRLDILINNAGVLSEGMIFNIPEADWDRTQAVHLKGHFACSKCTAIVMRQQRYGRIVNTSSDAGTGAMGHSAYAAAKEGIVRLTRSMAKGLGRYGIIVNAIRPRAGTRMSVGPTIEENVKRLAQARKKPGQFMGPELEELSIANLLGTPLYRPQNVAPFVVWLCTSAAAHINGRIFSAGGPQIGLFSEPFVEARILSDKDGWTLDDLDAVYPSTFLARDMNPQRTAEERPAQRRS